MNKVIFMGRLTRDPEISVVDGKNGDLSIANFRIAVGRKYAKKGEDPKADFFNCTAFSRLAEFVEDHVRP